MAKGDDGRADELAIQAEVLEVVDVLIQQRERLAGLLKRANRLPSFRRVSLAWNRGDECADSLGWQLGCTLAEAARGPIEHTGDGAVLGGVIACLRELAELTPEECAASEAWWRTDLEARGNHPTVLRRDAERATTPA